MLFECLGAPTEEGQKLLVPALGRVRAFGGTNTNTAVDDDLRAERESLTPSVRLLLCAGSWSQGRPVVASVCACRVSGGGFAVAIHDG